MGDGLAGVTFGRLSMDLFPHVYACICKYFPFIDASNLIHFEKKRAKTPRSQKATQR